MIHLTRREQELLVDLTRGNTYALMARKYCIQPDSIKMHFSNMRRKTNTRNQTQLLRWALREAKRMEKLWPMEEA